MTVMGSDSVDGVDPEQLHRWILRTAPGYHWTGWQGLDLIRPSLESRILAGAWEQAVLDPATEVLVDHDRGTPVAGTFVRPKPMETEHFGVRTEAVANVVAAAGLDSRRSRVSRLLRRTVAEARDRGTDLLVLRVSADDVETLSAAQREGFVVMESTTTWLADSTLAAGPASLPPGVEVEIHEGDVATALSPEEIDRLVEHTARWGLNHFRADPELDDASIDRFYAEWIPNIAAGEFSDCLFVARSGGRLLGVHSEISDRTLLDLTGTDLRVCEWVVVLEPGHGAGKALVSTAGRQRFPGGTHHSWETQARNLQTIRCIEQTGVARPVRSAYTLHAWPGRR